MTGYCYGEREPTELCPYCGARCEADFVDNGVAYQQCGPYHCDQCGATEIGPYDEPRDLTELERKNGWYAPGSEPGSSANVIGGRVVSHVVMRDTYRDEFVGNPRWEDKAYVEEWWDKVRQA